MGAELPHLILLHFKLEYIPNILPQTGCTARLAFRVQKGSKCAKSAIFAIFRFFIYIWMDGGKVWYKSVILECHHRLPLTNLPHYYKNRSRTFLFEKMIFFLSPGPKLRLRLPIEILFFENFQNYCTWIAHSIRNSKLKNIKTVKAALLHYKYNYVMGGILYIRCN